MPENLFLLRRNLTLLLVCCFGMSGAAMAETSGPKNGEIVLHVFDEAGAAVPDLPVRLFSYEHDEAYWKDSKQKLQTDSRGIVHFRSLPVDASYLAYATTNDKRIGFRECVITEDAPVQEVQLKLERPIATTVRVRSRSGKPVEDAEIWSLSHTGLNGSFNINPAGLRSIGVSSPMSDSTGQLTLPSFPPGKFKLRIINPDFVPTRIQEIQVGASAEATLDSGATVTLQLTMDPGEKLVDAIVMDLRTQSENSSELIGPLRWLHKDGTATFTVAPGDYYWFRLKHQDFVAIPTYVQHYGHSVADEMAPFHIKLGSNPFAFHLKRKVNVRGRVINRDTGRPVAESTVQGEVHSGKTEGPFASFAEEWTHCDWADTNANGGYEIKLAAGRSRVNFKGQGMIAAPASIELNVTPDGSTLAPDFDVSPIPTVRGTVQDQQGAPTPNVVVRFRGSMLTWSVEPVVTDANGKFELAAPSIPEDLQTHKRLLNHTVVAFHPTKPLDGQASVRLDDASSAGNVVVKLERHDPSSLTIKFSDLSPFQRGVVSKEEKETSAAISRVGKPSPELDGAHWLNIDKNGLSLANLRGKYVLLQFWTTWCGPCHADLPSVRLVEKLYRNKGLVVIGVHDNSMPLDAIKKDVEKEKLTYPIVVDHPDGRILTSYNVHGWPTYLLIGPDGKVIYDETLPAPSLRSFKIEIVRKLLMKRSAE